MLRSFRVHKGENKTVIAYKQGFWTLSAWSLLSLFCYVLPSLCVFIIFADPFSGSWPQKIFETSTMASEILLIVGLGVWALRRYLADPAWQVEIAREGAGGIAVRYGSIQLVQPTGLCMTMRSSGEDQPSDSEHNPGFWAEVKITGAEQPPLYLRTATGFPGTADKEGTELSSILARELNIRCSK